MRNYAMRHVILIAPTLLFISLLVFPFSYLLQGDPVDRLFRSGGSSPDERVQAAIRAEYGLDRPLGERLVDWVHGLVTGDLSPSVTDRARVEAPIGRALRRSLELVAAAMTLAVIGGAVLGLISGLRPRLGRAPVIRVLLGGSVRPRTLWGTALLLIGWPAALTASVGPLWGSLPVIVGDMTLSATANPTFTLVLWPYQFLILRLGGEVLVIDLIFSSLLALLITGGVARLVQEKMLLRADHLSPGRVWGPAEYWVFARRGLRDTAIPLLTLLVLLAPSLLAASFALELFLGRSGLGHLTLGALFRRETTVVWSVVLLAAALLMLVKLAGDLLSVYADSRGPMGASEDTGAPRGTAPRPVRVENDAVRRFLRL